MRAVFVAAALVVMGCGGSSQQPAASAKPTSFSAPKAARAAKSGIFFVVDYEALLPVACFDAKKNSWTSGEPCYELMPEGSDVQLELGRTATARGWRVPELTECVLGTPLLEFEGAKTEKPATFAVWPPGDRARRISWEATKKGAESLPAADRTRLARAMAKVVPSESVHLIQAATADLDGDGASDFLFSATGGGFDPAGRKGAAALFYGAADGELTPVRTSDHAVFRVEGVVDVDDDGVLEVWSSERTFHVNGMRTDSMTLARRSPQGLTAMDTRETCWPPAKVK